MKVLLAGCESPVKLSRTALVVQRAFWCYWDKSTSCQRHLERQKDAFNSDQNQFSFWHINSQLEKAATVELLEETYKDEFKRNCLLLLRLKGLSSVASRWDNGTIMSPRQESNQSWTFSTKSGPGSMQTAKKLCQIPSPLPPQARKDNRLDYQPLFGKWTLSS